MKKEKNSNEPQSPAFLQGTVVPSLPLDKSFYRQCNECLKWRMIGTQCKNPLTMACDNDERYFLKGNMPLTNG
tara:strand:+ start:319 stop:537 length:219 start_codon:yes stop_codon:yes gene_type:complete